MAAQQLLFNVIDFGKVRNKRIRYTKAPERMKSYEFWHINPETQEVEYNGDEKHIFRIHTLYMIYSDIFAHCMIDCGLTGEFEKKECDGIIFWGAKDDKIAEIKDSWNLSLKDRVKLHLRLLRYLREGLSVRESLRKLYEK